MNIGILVHSQTGHTHSVAQRIEKKLTEQGHTCRIEQIRARDEEAISKGQVMQPIQLINPPDPLAYDALILGAPVWGFSLSKIMNAYLDRLPKLSGKKVACFITQSFPHPIFGGNRSLRQLKSACQQMGASVYASGIVNWSNSRREDQIENLVKSLSQIA
jgi:flavodoxin